MKKMSTSVLTLGLIFGVVSPVFAEGHNNNVQSEQNSEQQDALFKYSYNGVDFSGNYELSEEEILQMYN
ncbi:hypothetical protein [Bacillus rubiinfantis]|uniref:hypothetical protein n=1 Tax=Bacillus rubiinfantis TaxID=1499680 RepID=UPI001CA3104B|nr:hypothetical protein [Bacillus rubiinfantis]